MLIDFKLNGKTLHLLLNGDALFNCYERFGQDKTLLEQLEGEDRESFRRLVWMLCEFALQGELYRRYQGQDRGTILPYSQALAEILPSDIPRVKLALTATIREGFTRRHAGEEEMDPWLAEIEKKKKELHAPNIFASLRRVWGSRSGTA